MVKIQGNDSSMTSSDDGSSANGRSHFHFLRNDRTLTDKFLIDRQGFDKKIIQGDSFNIEQLSLCIKYQNNAIHNLKLPEKERLPGVFRLLPC